MDNKNNTTSTFLMMALMLLVFMWCTRPQQKTSDNNGGSETKTEQALPSAPSQQFYSEADVPAIANIVMAKGRLHEDGTYTLTDPGMTLTYSPKDSTLSGIVKVDTTEAIVGNMLRAEMAGLTQKQFNAAHSKLRANLDKHLRYSEFAPFFYGEEEKTVIENENMRLTLSNKGGIIEEAVLKKYNNERFEPIKPVTLFTAQTGSYGFSFVTAEQHIHTDSLYFTPMEATDSGVVMALNLGPDQYWRIRYSVTPEDYMVKMTIEQKGMDAVIPPSTSTLAFNWRQKMERNEKSNTFEERNSSVMYKLTKGSPDELSSTDAEVENISGQVKWVAFKNQFFSSVAIPSTPFSSAEMTSTPLKDNPVYVKDMGLKAIVPYSTTDANPASFDLYLGPNDYPLLNSIDDKISPEGDDLELNRLVPLGWSLFRWINQLIVIPVFSFLSKFISNYGIIILLLTLFIKLILFPFTYKSYMSQAKMRALAPEIKEINDKYPGQENAMKRQQETMSLYSRVGASPFSGCLPMLLQMPILIAMFAFFPSAIELRGQSFLWAHDLAAPDSILTLPFTIPWYGNHVSLFCLLMTVTNIIYSKINMQNQPGSSSMPGMKWMMYLMPVMFLFIFNDYASGLSYYYFLSLLITIIQTWIFRKCINEKKVRAELLANAKNPKKKKGGFMARLEAMQKQQEAMMREQAKQRGKRK
ncbi:MAG: membrane protein insertase YidC [Clostridium sp.]|nr:membrane protein insertase YidC [Clostridium sp.]